MKSFKKLVTSSTEWLYPNPPTKRQSNTLSKFDDNTVVGLSGVKIESN